MIAAIAQTEHQPTLAMDRLRARVAAAWKPRPRISPAEWCERNVRLTDLEAAKGRYDLTGRPWWREILEAVADPVVRSIRLRASTQVGKTLALMAVILYLARNSPASALVVLPGQSDCQEFRERLYALAEASGLAIPRESNWNMRHMDIGGMRIYLAWSGSRRRLRGRRCKYVFLSEVDVYSQDNRAANAIEAAKQRVKAFPRHLILYESSPIPEPSAIDELERNSQQHRWECKCPHCGTYQVPQFFPKKESQRGGVVGTKDEHGQWTDYNQVIGIARYVCVNGCEITSQQKPLFTLSGRWRSNAEQSRRDLGFHLWALHSNATFGHIAREYLLAVAGGTVPEFFQHELGRAYRARVTMPTWQELAARLSVPDYHRGQVPPDAWFLIASADVQENEVYLIVRAFGDRRTSWLVDWFVFDREAGDASELVKSDLIQIDEHLAAWYPIDGTNPRGEHRLKISLLGIDANYRTLDVHNWILSHRKKKHIRAIRGEGQMAPSQKYRKTTVKESRRERDDGSGPVVYEGGLDLWGINVNAFRLSLVDQFRGAADQPGAFLLPSDVLITGQHYLKQLVNEPPAYERGKDGRRRLVFREINTQLGHDFWDCEVNASALAQMFVDQLPGNPDWDSRKWKKSPPPEPDKPRAPVPDRAAR